MPHPTSSTRPVATRRTSHPYGFGTRRFQWALDSRSRRAAYSGPVELTAVRIPTVSLTARQRHWTLGTLDRQMSLRNSLAHRNLLYLLSLKELRTRYKKSVLGWIWSLLNPLSQMLIFTVIFLYVFVATPLAGDPSGLKNFPLYFLCGLLPWNFFSITTNVSMGNLQGGAGLIKKVTFPHEHLVFSIVVAQFVTLLIETRHPRHRPSHRRPERAGLATCPSSPLSPLGPVHRWCLPGAQCRQCLLPRRAVPVGDPLARCCSTPHRSSTSLTTSPMCPWGGRWPVLPAGGPPGASSSPSTKCSTTAGGLRRNASATSLGLALVSFAFGAWVFGKLSPRFAEEM